ncbi:MAG: S-layer homology domain-containing protein [Firmicutes bacterium]|nr:S-layer homology domain-containing protein [Bacillota bacterium]
MKQLTKKAWSLFLALALIVCFALPAMAVSDSDLSAAVAKSAAYIQNTVKEPQVASIGGEWAVIGLARSGQNVPQSYWDNYYAKVEEYVKAKNGVLHTKKYTEYSRVALALTSIGADPTNVAGYNLLTPLGDFDKTVWQGVNGPIWALIALDSAAYEMPVNTEAVKQASRQMYVDEILRRQLDDGGWNLTGEGGSGQADPDITGMALQALANYKEQAKVAAAVDKALACLSKMQDEEGGYSSWNAANSESVVQVIVGLCALGLDLQDSRFVKNGHGLLDNLLSYSKPDGSFIHTNQGSGNDQMSSEQGLYGLVAALRAVKGQNSLYNMSDCNIHVSGQPGGNTPPSPTGMHPDVKKVPVVAEGVTFADIANHKNKAAIEALAARKIINGYNAESFGPDDTMTRAQFATIVVNGLGLPQQTVNTFADVPANAWFAPYVGAAYKYGIVNGRSATVFDPAGTITRQEAAAMVARSANKLCGVQISLNESEIAGTLAKFGDAAKISDWARENMAFCYKEGIMDPSDQNAKPTTPILRWEIAQMLYNLLEKVDLL